MHDAAGEILETRVPRLSVTRRENIIAVGNSGTGKTRIGLGLGLAACQKGLSVGFYIAAALVHELLELGTRSGYFACNGNSLDISS